MTTTGAHSIVTSNKTTLIELTAEGAVLETRMTSDGTGKVVESPPQTYLQRRMFPLFGNTTKDDVGKPPKGSKQGEETIRCAGREIKAVWFDSSGRTDAGASSSRTWMSDDVPGKLVKAITRVPSVGNTTTVELVEFTVPGKDNTPTPATGK